MSHADLIADQSHASSVAGGRRCLLQLELLVNLILKRQESIVLVLETMHVRVCHCCVIEEFSLLQVLATCVLQSGN